MPRRRSNGEGSIKKRTLTRKDKSTYIRYSAVITVGWNAEGKQEQQEGPWRKKSSEASQDLQAMRKARDAGVLKPDTMLVGDYMDYWLTQAQADLRPRSAQAYRGDIKNHIKPRIGKLKLDKLTPIAVQQWQSVLTKETSPYVARKSRACLSAALTQAVRWQLIAHNPCDGALNVKLPDYEARIWETSEARRFLEVAKDHRYALAFILTLNLGLRIGELRGLKWADLITIDGKPHIHIRRTAHGDSSIPRFGPPKTARSNRILPVPDDLLALLADHRVAQTQHRELVGEGWLELDLIVTTSRGGAVTTSTLRDDYYELIARAGVPKIKFHSLRHSAGSLWLESGKMSLQTVSARLGHADITTTSRIYIHYFKDAIAGSAMTMEEMLAGKTGK